jgi:N-acetylglutamate synthase-like GNAT family acetyltransferase
MSIIQIRKAKISDWRFIRHLVARECLNIESSALKYILCEDLQNVYIGTLDGKLSGFMHLGVGPDVLAINTLCVRYRDRRKNVGMSLILAALSSASACGASTVLVRTKYQNVAMHCALEKAGFDREDNEREVLFWTEIGERVETPQVKPHAITRFARRVLYALKFDK